MAQWLTSQLANIVCSAVAIGFVSVEAKTNVQYGDGEKTKYDGVKKCFDKVGVQFLPTASKSQAELPYIAALTPRASNPDIVSLLTQDYYNYLKKMNDAANALEKAPYGAYIGGSSSISTLFIVGPSDLDQYKPQFRSGSDSNIKDFYIKAVDETNKSIDCICKVSQPRQGKYKLDLQNMNARKQKDLADGHLFSSFHGMVRAITKFSSSIDANAFIFEIALGRETSKVSSCLPCSIFMQANGTPASSTHLGRGDYWNIPSDCPVGLRNTWKKNVEGYYAEGMKKLGTKLNVQARKTLDSNLAVQGGSVAEVFLEALTFQSSFIEKIESVVL
jgi:hypothetical protein